jgi:hypothetical protein
MNLVLGHHGSQTVALWGSILATHRRHQDIQWTSTLKVLFADFYTRMASCGCFVLLHFCCSVCSSSYKYQLAFFMLQLLIAYALLGTRRTISKGSLAGVHGKWQ